MLHFNSGTKRILNQCMELLIGKVACAQTRNISKRVPWTYVNRRTLDTNTTIKERQRVNQYEESKRLSMWEQKNPEADEISENERMDHLHYKSPQEYERTYNCTWTDFPDNKKPKDCKILSMIENAPVNRRKPGCCPETAKPWDDVAKNFINQWRANSKNNFMTYRNKYENSTAAITGKINRKKMFYY